MPATPSWTTCATIVETGATALKTQMDDWTVKHNAVVEAQTALLNVDETLRSAVRAA